jgi:4-aminobutyrate aminotransferase-like enzyme
VSIPAIERVVHSLNSLLGNEYMSAVCRAKSFADCVPLSTVDAIADEKVEFYPKSFQRRVDELVDEVGLQVCDSYDGAETGAATNSYTGATRLQAAPLIGLGFLRIGEDGRVYLIAKSEHYHASLGHSFPGFRLLEHASRLGIPNATHNNTRGHIVRILEEELIRTANGIPRGDSKTLREKIASLQPHLLNRVINLETGSLAVEASLKMMLARFYRLERTGAVPRYGNRTPVFLVMADDDGGTQANYHGTTILTQTMRELWPELGDRLAKEKIFVVKAARINDIDHFKQLLETYDSGNFKIAGFLHEIVLMNYGGIRLSEDYLKAVYESCREHDIPVLVDEIQSCIWSPELFMFREYGLQPDFVSIGKGFPGGQYSASKVLTTAAMDNLNQFGALVTNGQEELAALSYLITMEFAQANRGYIEEIGAYYEESLWRLARRHPSMIMRIEGKRHLSSIFFETIDKAERFTAILRQGGIDITAQSYKPKCPPAALTKIPLISTPKMIDFLVARMDTALERL